MMNHGCVIHIMKELWGGSEVLSEIIYDFSVCWAKCFTSFFMEVHEMDYVMMYD